MYVKIIIISDPLCDNDGPTENVQNVLSHLNNRQMVIFIGNLVKKKKRSHIAALHKMILSCSRHVYLCSPIKYVRSCYGSTIYTVTVLAGNEILLLTFINSLKWAKSLKFLNKKLRKYNNIPMIIFTHGDCTQELLNIQKKHKNIMAIIHKYVKYKYFDLTLDKTTFKFELAGNFY